MRTKKIIEIEYPGGSIDWDNYIHKNSLGNQDCQLVTAINACYYLTGEIVRQDSKLYKQLLKLGGCEYGSCCATKKIWKALGIWEDKRLNYYDLRKYLKKNCFIELTVWHKRHGYHSVAIVDWIKKAECIRVINFRYETSIAGWMFLEDIKPFLKLNPDRSEPRYEGRTFKVINNK